MTTDTITRAALGFTAHFMMQLDLDELEALRPVRLAGVDRSQLRGLSEGGALELHLTGDQRASNFAVGDWVLADDQNRVVRRLDPFSELSRRAAGTDRSEQIIAANLDTLFIVTSANADFNVARLERYLALAAEAHVTPVIVVTKADLTDDVDAYRQKAEALMPGVSVVALDATGTDVPGTLAMWCGPGQTVALVGSSGVGKTTLMNRLTGLEAATQDVRDDDAKGRHTTTARALYAIKGGGWVIDTPGMRALRLHDSGEGVAAVFADIEVLAGQCRFNDCAHETEPGCAVRGAIEAGDLDAARLYRWRKLLREDNRNTQSIAGARAEMKAFQKHVSRAVKDKSTRRGN